MVGEEPLRLQLQSRWCSKLTGLRLTVGLFSSSIISSIVISSVISSSSIISSVISVSVSAIMITPAFDLSQDPEYLTITVRVPYTRTSEFDLYVDGTDFKFYAKPYFLR